MIVPAAPSPTKKLSSAGVSIWLNNLSRDRLISGSLKWLIEERGVVGITMNPTILAAALAKHDVYMPQIKELATAGAEVDEAVLAICIDDVREACDLLAPIDKATQHVDGRVSIELDPILAHNAEATVAMAARLSATIGRENVLIKIPATDAGLSAITATIIEGISVNVTLIISLERYREVINAYLLGLERALENGKDLTGIHSVASFSVSCIDTEVDKLLDAIGTDEAKGLKGKAGLANARLAYQIWEQSVETERWRRLAAAGANPQRPLWDSTDVNDSSMPDTLYVTGLVAPNTVSTMSEKTLESTYDHAEITPNTITERYIESVSVLNQLIRFGVSYQEVVRRLETQSLRTYTYSWAELLATARKALNAVRQL